MNFRSEVVKYARLLESEHLVNAVEGNISLLDRESGELFITPSSTRKSFLTDDMIAIMKGDTQISGSCKRSSEYLLHNEALRARPDCHAVVHTHAPYLTAYAYCAKDIEIRCSVTFALMFERIPCIPYGEAATAHIADGLADALKESDIVLLANHGAVSVGRDLESAVRIMECAEEVLKIMQITESIGKVQNFTDVQFESLCNNHPGSKRNRK